MSYSREHSQRRVWSKHNKVCTQGVWSFHIVSSHRRVLTPPGRNAGPATATVTAGASVVSPHCPAILVQQAALPHMV